ncbi:MAG: polyprenyl synthetase family protein [Bacteroidales bacterium]
MNSHRMILPDEALRLLQPELEKIRMSEQPAELYEPIRYILSLGGKRLRPVLALMCCSMYRDDVRAVMPAALAIELFHNFTLLHDDIMDNAPLRRNKPTVHEKWNANVAILSGDAMLIKAYELLACTEKKHLPGVLDVFNRTALEVCEGQQYDMNFELRAQVPEEEYLRMIELKTAVLLGAAMQTGALCGDAPEADIDLLYKAGRFMGLAFQLQDDWLDSFGDTSTFGKTIGGDIAANKKTWLYIKTLGLASARDKQELMDSYASPTINRDEKIQKVTQLFRKYEVDQLAAEKVSAYSASALESLAGCSIRSEDLEVFRRLVGDLTNRKT